MSQILLGKGEAPVQLLTRYGSRHGFVAGATGTGKTTSLMVLAEGFSRLGVPVFMPDIKGDVAGLSQPGTMTDDVRRRVQHIGVPGYTNEGNPVVFWDLFGTAGHPIRTTVSEMGPFLLGRILELPTAQEGVLDIAFRIADEQRLLMLDLEDLRALLDFVHEHHQEVSQRYGLVDQPSVAAIQRALLTFERLGGRYLFGEPALDINDLMRIDPTGRGTINVLAADRIGLQPRLYSGFLLWLLSDLLENLPEAGDTDRPRIVFIFDEAHMLFRDAPADLVQRVVQVVRVVRSKGVGIYFCSQYPDDVPQEILGQVGNRLQHALRAWTAHDEHAIQMAAQSFPPNPRFDVAPTISTLGVGEALASTLQQDAVPLPVERALMCPPRCRMGRIAPEEREAVRARSPLAGKYEARMERESARDVLNKRRDEIERRLRPEPPAPQPRPEQPRAQPAPVQPQPQPPQPDPAHPATQPQPLQPVVPAQPQRPGPPQTYTPQRVERGRLSPVSNQSAGLAQLGYVLGAEVVRPLVRGLLGGLLGTRLSVGDPLPDDESSPDEAPGVKREQTWAAS